jgi:hypothetical protein
MAADTREILAAFAVVLVNDPTLTDPTNGILPLFGPDNLASDRKNSIFYTRPPTVRTLPCVVLADVFSGPSIKNQQERKSRRQIVGIDVEIWGQSAGGGTAADLGAITAEIDALMEGGGSGVGSSGAPWWNGAMDTADWQFEGIDTSDHWQAFPMTDLKGSRVIERRIKTFWVTAADKT